MRNLVLSALVASPFLISAQEAVLDTVVVSASRWETSLESANRNVVVIGNKEIENAPTESVAGLLDFVVGVDSRQRGTFGLQTDLSINGGTFEQVLVLLDGVRLTDPQTGHHIMNLPIQKSDIERIEVLLGGGTYIFGGNAFSGAINIITKKSKKDQLSVDFEGGSYNSYQASVKQDLKGQNHSSSLSFSTLSSDGFKRNTDFKKNNLFGQTHIKLKDQKLDVNAGYTWQEFGAQNFYSSNFPTQFEKTRTLFINTGLKSGDKIKIDRQVYWRRNWDEFQLFREGDDFYTYEQGLFIDGTDTVPAWYTSHNYHRSDVIGGKLNIGFESKYGRTSIGSEYRFEGVVSNNLGEPMEDAINIPGSRGSYTLEATRENLSLAAEQSKDFERLSLSLALLANYNTDYDLDFYPAVTAGYAIGKKQRVYASFNRSFRLPSFTDLYYRLGGATGSKDLRAENSLNYEVGYKTFSKNVFFNINLFRRQGTDIIDWVQLCDTCGIIASNTTEVNFTGLNTNLKYSSEGFWESTLKIDFVEVGYSYIQADEEDFDFESLYVFDYLRNKANLRVQHTFFKKLKLDYSISYQDRNGTFIDAETREAQEYEDVLLINARVSYAFELFNLYISGQNLLDRTYFDRGNVELPGSWLWSGVRFQL